MHTFANNTMLALRGLPFTTILNSTAASLHYVHAATKGSDRLSTKSNFVPSRRFLLLPCNASTGFLPQESHEILEYAKKDDMFNKQQQDLCDNMTRLIDSVRSMLRSMDDGEISISPYDTAWVALAENVKETGAPQFPSSLEWISKNQNSDGSWGDKAFFLAHDRIINTLACVIALTKWNLHPDKCERGVGFIRENIYKLEDENDEHMPIGFEVALPSLIEIAKELGIDIPDDESHPALQKIYARKNLKLKRIPKDLMHEVQTPILHSLEGMYKHDLDWKKLLKLQSPDGSFFFSPSSTAFAFQQTKDENCLRYVTNCIQKFNGAVPNVYPVDMFEHLWAVDRLQRLGISRYFQSELEECIDYVQRYWTNNGISFVRSSKLTDIDDTSMGFRLLRLYGYDVSADVFNRFKNDKGEFICMVGQSTQAVTGIYNLYRASQVKFHGEDILTEAKEFSVQFLKEKRANNSLIDKWIISKDIPGEVGYALDVPWYASLPRVETRFYLEQYGGEDDVWIGKTLYRMPFVNNNTYLELAKLDFNNCQALHQQEWKSLQKWYEDCNFGEHQLSDRKLLFAFYVAAVSVFEKEKAEQRISWAKTVILMETIKSYHEQHKFSKEQLCEFTNEFKHYGILKYNEGERYKTRSMVEILIKTLNQMSMRILLEQGIDIHQHMQTVWLKWLKTWEEASEIGKGDAELILACMLDLNGENQILFKHPKYQQLLEVTSRVCYQLRVIKHRKAAKGCVIQMGDIESIQIESDMEELAKLVLMKSSDDLDSHTKQHFMDVARSFYYAAYCSPETINSHIAKVLFERVV